MLQAKCCSSFLCIPISLGANTSLNMCNKECVKQCKRKICCGRESLRNNRWKLAKGAKYALHKSQNKRTFIQLFFWKYINKSTIE